MQEDANERVSGAIQAPDAHIDVIEDVDGKWALYSRLLGGGVVLVVLTLLSAIIYVLVVGVFNPPAPRTAYEARLVVLDEARASSPHSGKAWAESIMLYTLMGRTDEAEQLYRNANALLAEIPEELVAVELAWAQSLLHQERWEDAIAQADLVLSMEDEVVAAVELAHPTAAEAGLVEMGEVAPAHLVKADAYMGLAAPQEAIEEFDAALELEPRAADIYWARGVAHWEAGDLEAARRDMEEALRYDPNYAPARAGLAELEESGGN